ncbi:UbiA family prenyltransferase [Humisphaera borealis]|uniref:UbiA family prenyltransferase n=1 Tax=Humisphaera borealis TaxID=2807512 RepID=A0A7M2X0A2_9BACT|nr:UbiA family prenyltransferase [Humisphaera borealis]QOV90842.1 UbiA family prenyltransferase [Humisphaera borealis]
MPPPWSQRLLTLLQLTRMALVFTAIADAWCGLLLWEAHGRPDAGLLQWLDPWRLGTIALVSIGLYGFGMTLNDIIDRRRDARISPGRPLPSGKVSVAAAVTVCTLLLLLSLGSAALFRTSGGPNPSLALAAATLALIWFYDAAGKYLVGPGLVTLGLVRFCQALIPSAEAQAPFHPLLWQPLWLLNHVAILSTVCYAWEEKRPALNIKHWAGVFFTLATIDAAAIWFIGTNGPGSFLDNLRLDWRLIGPVLGSVAFIAMATRVHRQAGSSREAGQATMLYGLLWLIVYDALFAGLYVHWAAGVALLLLLPLAYGSVKVMRAWSKLVAASHRPDFKRAGA